MDRPDPRESRQYSKLQLIPLIAAGVAGNLFDIPLLMHASFQWGSVFALLAMYFYGIGWGSVAAAAISIGACLFGNNPYLMIIMTAEAALVGLLVGRRRMGMVQADTIFWVLAGLPSGYVVYRLCMQLPAENSYFLTIKLAVNAIANSMIARLILTGRALTSRHSLTPLREAIFNLLASFVFCPIFALFILSSKRDLSEIDASMRQELVQQSHNMNNLLADWLQNRRSLLTGLAKLSNTEYFPQLISSSTDFDPNFRRIEFRDADDLAEPAARRGASLPEAPQARLPGPDSLERIRQTRRPVLWEVVAEQGHPYLPAAVLVEPVPRSGPVRGCIVGILGLEQLQDILNNSLDQGSTRYSVLDRQRRVVLTNHPDQKLLTNYVQAQGSTKEIGNGVSQWFPYRTQRRGEAELWEQSSYLYQASLGDSGWFLVMEQPLTPSQLALFRDYRDKFTILCLILLGSLCIAEMLSKKVVSVLDQFNALTDGLPGRLMAHRFPIEWPKTVVAEADHLIANFRSVAESLTPLYSQVSQLNETLEARITERTQALATSQALTIDVMDSLLSNISVLDENGDIVLVNDPWVRFARENGGADSGYLGTNMLEVCRNSMRLDGSVSAASAFLGINKVLQGERDYFTMEYACETPQGKLWYQMTASRLSGARIGAVVSHSDITVRKRAEEALQDSEEKHRLLFESAGDGIFILDRRLRVLTANPFACYRLGYQDADWSSLSFDQLEFPGQGSQLPDLAATLLRGESILYETVLVHKDGSLLATEVNARITCWDGEVAIIAICRDLTERKRAQEELSEARQFIEQVINCAQEGIVVYDMDLRYRCWNPFMEALTGLPAHEVMGKHPGELFPREVQSGLLEHLKDALGGTARRDFDSALVSAGGAEHWTSSLSSQLLNARGELAGVITTVREITWRKQMESELRQALKHAEDANAGMRRLLRTVSHEFRTPLGLLIGCADILDRHWGRLEPEQRHLQTGYIRNAAFQLTVLVNSVTSYSLAQVEPAGQTMKHELGALCASIAADACSVWQSGHAFDVVLDPDCGTGHINEILLRRVLENLLSNAFRYTASEGRVGLRVGRAEDMLLLTVTDAGIGISEEDQKLIFDPFYRGQNIADRRGLGLGLAIVQEALAKLGGGISVTSRLGVGSTMQVTIPVAE
jgi:PAS domain S-box-containing protein